MSSASNSLPLVWLASYPKSGNTWLRFSVAALIAGEMPSSAFVKERMPDIHEPGFKPFPMADQGYVFAKTHYMFSDTMPGAGQTVGFIYMVRNPIDVLASNYNYIRRNAPNRILELDSYIDAYLENYGEPNWIRLKMGSWIENISTWIEESSKRPGLVMKYEDMLKDPIAVLKLIANFLDIERSDEQVQQAADLCSFESMRSLESREVEAEREGMFYDPRKSGVLQSKKAFVNAGGSSGSKALLSDEQRAKIAERFRPIAEQIGYEL